MRTPLILTMICMSSFCQKIPAPRAWNDKDLEEWATPVAGLNLRPSHYTEREYYEAPIRELVRTYPVYFPGREPAGYWEKLQRKGPEPLLQPGARTRAGWIDAGKIVFHELDVESFRLYDPDLTAMVRSAEALRKAGARAEADGTVAGMRWVPTSKGIALSLQECAGCHTRVMPDGSYLDGAPGNTPGNGVIGRLVSHGLASLFGDDSPQLQAWRMFSVPWLPDDIHEGIKSMQRQDLSALMRSGNTVGTVARINGSPYYTTKIPDLIGIGERRYIDHTATHRLRDAGDLMRYAALVGCCDAMQFGPHAMLSGQQRRIASRYPDEVLFALAEYLLSLQPPPNPNRNDPRAAAGEKVFAREGCGFCHTPPFYTNNKLTLAQGFTPPKDHPLAADLIPLSVGTDPGLALKTRKGTGFYKVPSLKGVWYRGLYGHDGSIASLEDWFTRTAKGHEFGLKLNAEEKAALVAFLRTL